MVDPAQAELTGRFNHIDPRRHVCWIRSILYHEAESRSGHPGTPLVRMIHCDRLLKLRTNI